MTEFAAAPSGDAGAGRVVRGAVAVRRCVANVDVDRGGVDRAGVARRFVRIIKGACGSVGRTVRRLRIHRSSLFDWVCTPLRV